MDEIKYSTTEQLLYKLDRTLAIGGLVILGAWALYIATDTAVNVAMAVVGALAGYVGGRTK